MAKTKTISTKNYERKITKATYHQNKKETTKSGNRKLMHTVKYKTVKITKVKTEITNIELALCLTIF